MGTARTVAVSLPGEIAARLKEEAQRNGKRASHIVLEALQAHFKKLEDERLEEAYRAYYSDPKVRAQRAREVRAWMRVSSWPGRGSRA